MVIDFFLPVIEEKDLENMCSQQDGATCHTSRVNRALLQETFSCRVISYCGDINWPPRACDLTPLDFFAGLRVYANKPSTVEHLKTNICQVIAEMTLNMCEEVVENYLQRINACNALLASHLNDEMSTFKLYNKREIS